MAQIKVIAPASASREEGEGIKRGWDAQHVFSRYAAIVKNLRGVVLLDLEEVGVMESVKWLSRRFRYRNLGLTPAIVERFESGLRDMKRGKPFRALVYPVETIQALTEELVRAGLPREVAELLIFASTYVSPAMLVGDRYRGYLEELATDAIVVCRELSIGEWKLHLRIADYTVLDFYEESVDEALKALEEPSYIDRLLEGRRARISRDRRRYWRISCEGGRPFLYYIDNLWVAYSCGVLRREPDWAAALAIIPAIYVPPGMT